MFLSFFLVLLNNYIAQRRRRRRRRTGATESNGRETNSKRYGFLITNNIKSLSEQRLNTIIITGVKAGDKVLLPEFGGQAVKLDEGPQKKEFLLYRDEEILGILQD